MAPKSRPNSAPRITARSVNSLMVSSVEINGRNSPGGAVELHGRSLKEGLPRRNQIGLRAGLCRTRGKRGSKSWVAADAAKWRADGTDNGSLPPTHKLKPAGAPNRVNLG